MGEPVAHFPLEKNKKNKNKYIALLPIKIGTEIAVTKTTTTPEYKAVMHPTLPLMH